MRTRTNLAIATLLAALLGWLTQSGRAQQPSPGPAVLITNVKVFDGKSDKLSAQTSILIIGNKIEKIGVGKRKVLDVALAHIGEREDELVRILVREAAQENGVGHAEDRGAGADSESDGEDGRGGKDRALAQSAERVCEVAKEHISLPEFVYKG